MSAREKIRTLYSRNGIRIIKTENLPNTYSTKRWVFEKTLRREALENTATYKECGNYITTKHESPLGFYYYTRDWQENNVEKPKSVIYRKYIIWLDGTKYELEYPIDYYANNNTQSINIEIRPWDILPGYKGMPDNMIEALVKEINKLIDIIFEYRNLLKMKDSFNEERKSIMIDLFGYEDGPKVQPNDIKILSHGFDLKQSFRKRKES